MWIFRKTLSVGNFYIPGWSSVFPEPSFINDGTIAIFIAVLLFIVPESNKRRSINLGCSSFLGELFYFLVEGLL
jgi:sodium-dependent dicarboxylate transporter 2/3/5